ncbi:MAG: hypothetical protein SFV81_15280 [Pirellulaceae bacterium]|nr:hypothetical protein [Pirellulaceae bacterium]
MHTTRVFRQLRWLLMLTLASLSGCGGCKRDNEKLTREELEKRAKEQKEALEMGPLLTLPIDSQTKIATVKPGHWFESQQLFKSNREDMQVVAVGDLERSNAPVNLPGTNMINEYSRRTSLPKGQTKTVDLQFFIPESGTKNDDPFLTPPRLMLRTQLRSWPLMTPIFQTPSLQGANELGRCEFQLAVVSPQALSYEYLTVLDAVYWRGDDLGEAPRTRSYQVSLLKPQDGKYALPHSMLTMTALAVLVWDDVSIDELTTDQQEAIVDWLHWGGQLVISGPSSWSRLQNSFLSPYLPATSADAAEFTTESFKEISDTWKVPDLSSREQTPLDILGPPVGGLKFKLSDGGQWLPRTGEMVAERQVGRGRVVVTAFPLREPRITKWKYFSSFLSTGLLRRASRMITNSNEGMKIQNWAPPFAAYTKDARMHSNFRILSRDLPVSDNNTIPAVNVNQDTPNTNTVSVNPQFPSSLNVDTTSTPADLNAQPIVSAPQTEMGMNAAKQVDSSDPEAMRWGGNGAAWNDYSGVANQSQAALRKAAGIKLPDRWTIIYLVGGYLLFLVPVNWVVFKLLGRLEYAWIAAPILALVGVAVVTRVARLDIGFARRTTEIALLELQGEHTRGHLTRFVALYTSLSTNYTVEFPESGSVVLPLGDVTRVLRRAGSSVRNLRTNYGTSSGVQLEPLTVYSNSTEMLHAEQMVPLKGGVSLEKSPDSEQQQLMNATELVLKSTMVLRNVDGEISYAWLSDVEPKSLKNLDFKPADAGLWKHWNANQETASSPAAEGQKEAADTLWIGGILKDLVNRTPLMPGQTRLFAYTDDRPGELTITPQEDQFDGRCVVVAHLSSHQLGPVTPDRSIWSNRTEGTPPVDSGEPDPSEQ